MDNRERTQAYAASMTATDTPTGALALWSCPKLDQHGQTWIYPTDDLLNVDPSRKGVTLGAGAL